MLVQSGLTLDLWQYKAMDTVRVQLVQWVVSRKLKLRFGCRISEIVKR